VAGIGSVQGAIGAAFLGALGGKARWEATLATALVTAIAGELAAEKTTAPGSYQIAFLDALDALTPQDVVARAKVKVC
jgi:hydroxyethylthiazole kinase